MAEKPPPASGESGADGGFQVEFNKVESFGD